MDVVAFEDIGAEPWDAFLATSPDAWFWHTRHYSDFFLELHKGKDVSDLSFALLEDSRVLAACPLYLDSAHEVAQLGYGEEFVPFPALADCLSATDRERVLEYYFAELKNISKKYSASRARVRVSPLSKNHIGCALRPISPLLRHGFLDLTESTQVLDLREDAALLWTNVRKGHRSDIRRAEKSCQSVVWTKESITPHVFSRYQSLHHKDAGRVTRSQHSFDIMLCWIRAGYAVLAEATREGESIAFALIILFGKGAFYGSGCKDPDTTGLNASHMLQWKSILWLKAFGADYYETGAQYFGAQWFHVASEKEMGIAKYKRGFGGVTIPVYSGEIFYQVAALEKTLATRFDRLSNAFREKSGVAGDV